MESEERQKELFEFREGPKKIFPSLGKLFQKNEFENKYMVTMSPERLVFVAIGLIMALVLVYALGVERGKTMGRAVTPALTAIKTQPAAPVAAKPAAPAAAKPAAPAAAKPAAQITAPAAPAAAASTAAPPTAAEPTAFYTIIACTFTKDSTAATEVSRLKAEGLDAYIYQNGPYLQVCAGKFADQAGAKGYLAKVRRYFKDAYVKYRQQ